MAEENNPRWETPEQALKMSWHEVPQKNTHILVQLSRDWVIGLVVEVSVDWLVLQGWCSPGTQSMMVENPAKRISVQRKYIQYWHKEPVPMACAACSGIGRTADSRCNECLGTGLKYDD